MREAQLDFGSRRGGMLQHGPGEGEGKVERGILWRWFRKGGRSNASHNPTFPAEGMPRTWNVRNLQPGPSAPGG